MSRCVVVLVLCSLASLSAEELEISDELVASIGREVLPLVEKAVGGKARKRTEFRTVTRAQLQRVVRSELSAQFRNLGHSEEDAIHLAESSASLLSSILLGKFAYASGEILICPKNYREIAELLEMPEINSKAMLEVILTHEAVHAVSDAKYAWSKTIGEIKVEPQLEALSAVVEGHAQYLSRSICRDRGLERTFAIYTKSIGQLPPNLDAGQRMIARILGSKFVAQYVDGERFIRAILKESGAEILERAYSEPPVDLDAIARPRWFLDPKSRPKLEYDFKTALDVFVTENKGDWIERRVNLAPPQLEAALDLLSDDERKRIVSNLIHNRGLTLNPKADPTASHVVAFVYEFTSAADARFYFAAAEKLSDLKDKQFTDGLIRIKSSTSKNLNGRSWQGIWIGKKVDIRTQTLDVASALAHSGKVVVELIFSNHEASIDSTRDVIGKMFAKAVKQSGK